jgi:hypothetical protein
MRFGLCAKNIFSILGIVVDAIERIYVIKPKGKEYPLCISTLTIVKVKLTTCMIGSFRLEVMFCELFHWSTYFVCGAGSAHNRATHLTIETP